MNDDMEMLVYNIYLEIICLLGCVLDAYAFRKVRKTPRIN